MALIVSFCSFKATDLRTRTFSFLDITLFLRHLVRTVKLALYLLPFFRKFKK
jgi:hypothetical protein